MGTLTIYNDSNSQQINIIGFRDNTGNFVSGETLTGTIKRKGTELSGGSITFAAVEGSPGSYSGVLTGFTAPEGAAETVITDGSTISITLFTTIVTRSA